MIYLIFKDYSLVKNEIIDTFNHLQNKKDKNVIEIKEIKNKNYSLKKKELADKSNKKILENELPIPVTIFKKIYDNDKIIDSHQKKNINYSKSIHISSQSKSKITKKIPKHNFEEFVLNNFSYIKAVAYDKRFFWQYFFSLLKFEHILFFAIIPSKDYNSKAIKICIFLFTFALFFADNAIFMNEDAIHNIYENQGTFDFIYQIPQIIYSNIISFTLDKIIRFLSLFQDDVIDEKKKRIIKNKNEDLKKFFRAILIKYILFYVISFIFLIFFWFYISCFCFIYKNTQKYLIKDTIFSFGLSLITPFIFYLISAVLRICSLKKRNRHIMYLLSKWVLF